MIKIFKLGECEKGEVVQFINTLSKLKTGMDISVDKCYKEKQSGNKGIVISKTKTKTKVLEFDSIGSNSFKGLLILSNMKNSFLVYKLNPLMTFDPIEN
jgi:hypothetical protein